MISEHDFQEKYAAIFPRLDEQQRRLIAAADALFLGHGGGPRWRALRASLGPPFTVAERSWKQGAWPTDESGKREAVASA
jgi:hypothetical protein